MIILSTIFAILLTGCASLSPTPEKVTAVSPPSKVVKGTRDQVFEAAVIAMDVYLLVAASREGGTLRSEWEPYAIHAPIFGADVPAGTAGDWGAHRSRINFSFVPEPGAAGSFRIVVKKDLQKYDVVRGRFENAVSDQVEERRLLEVIAANIGKVLDVRGVQK